MMERAERIIRSEGQWSRQKFPFLFVDPTKEPAALGRVLRRLLASWPVATPFLFVVRHLFSPYSSIPYFP